MKKSGQTKTDPGHGAMAEAVAVAVEGAAPRLVEAGTAATSMVADTAATSMTADTAATCMAATCMAATCMAATEFPVCKVRTLHRDQTSGFEVATEYRVTGFRPRIMPATSS